jgi:hypothetical protein
MPSVGEIFPPLASDMIWRHKTANLNPEKIRFAMIQQHAFTAHFYKPIVEWRNDWKGQLLCTLEHDTYLQLTTRGYSVIGNTHIVDAAVNIIKNTQ